MLDRFITTSSALQWQRPAAGLIGFCRLHTSIDADEFAARLLAEPYRTFVMSGSAYGYPRHLRLGAGGGASARLDDALQRLSRFLATLH